MKIIRIFLSSPGDVATERERVNAVVNQLNRLLGDRLDIRLEIIEWPHLALDMGRTQEVINRQIGDYDIFVGIMWKRFGTPTGVAVSGTEEEFRIAYKNWERYERPRILFYFNQTPFMLKTMEETNQFARVMAFREELQQKGLVGSYESLEDFREQLTDHLSGVLKEWFPDEEKSLQSAGFSNYLTYLKEECIYIDIRGLASGEGRAHQFRIDELYIPLKTTLESHHGKSRDAELPHSAPLQEALKESRLVIRGEPGAGKTTFLRLLTYALCSAWLGEPLRAAAADISWPEQLPLPIFVRMGALTQFLRWARQQGNVQLPMDDCRPECLLHYLAQQSIDNDWHLTAEDFRRELEAGRCLVLLDGLDEAPDARVREQMSDLAVNLLKSFPHNQVVLTSRPAALTAEVMPAGFALVDILPLDEEAMTSFLSHWCRALYPDVPDKARAYQDELTLALTARPEIRRMARTPVMLTALAVVHWNETRLPEQRFELYESILTWLLRARKDRPGRLKAETCRLLLQKLALAMFTLPEGRARLITLDRAAELLAPHAKATEERGPKQQADYFLRDEMVDSGIIVKRDNSLEFWHLSFQEYLAAYEIAGRVEEEQEKLLFDPERVFSPEWRETVLLLAGVLHKQGADKINKLIDLILRHTPQGAETNLLPQQARCAALLGGVQADLRSLEFRPQNKAFATVLERVEAIFSTAYRSVPAKIRSDAADALALAGDPRFEKIDWIEVPAGEFWMGAQKQDGKGRNYDADSDESYPEFPVHRVALSAFKMSKYPVTVAQYAKFIDADGYQQEELWQAGGYGKYKAPRQWEEQLLHPGRPVVNVDWYEASAFAAWSKCRLPTEAEWEYAARGVDYRKWPWGDEPPDAELCNFDKTGLKKPSPVGIFPENLSPFGLVDMAGNVWEWCADWYGADYYQSFEREGVVKNPGGPKKGEKRVLRGGSWINEARGLRCANRFRIFPDFRGDFSGFRLVLSPHPSGL